QGSAPRLRHRNASLRRVVAGPRRGAHGVPGPVRAPAEPSPRRRSAHRAPRVGVAWAQEPARAMGPVRSRGAMDTGTEELTIDYRRRLRDTQPSNLPPDLDLFDEETSRAGLRLNRPPYSLKHPDQRQLFAPDEELGTG